MYLARDFYFEAAHHLDNYDGKCKNVHGHSYKLQVTISGQPRRNGMIIDFAELKSIVIDQVIKPFDHSDINLLIKQPTVENLCVFIWEKLHDKLPLYEVKIWETRDCSAFVRAYNENK